MSENEDTSNAFAANEPPKAEMPSAEAPKAEAPKAEAAAPVPENTVSQPEPPTNETASAVVNPAEPPANVEERTIEVNIADPNKGESLFDINKLGLLNDVYIVLSIEIGRAQIKIRDLLSLNKGAIIELDKLAGEPVDVYANGKLISTGNIITANGKYCVRLTSINEKNKAGVDPHGK